jgi:hypothetical protein
VTRAFLTACGFDHRAATALLPGRCIGFDAAPGGRVEEWRGRGGFIDYMVEDPTRSEDRWLTVVLNEAHGDAEE